jgi:5-methylcytosine-specific restriction endonuclease McrA
MTPAEFRSTAAWKRARAAIMKRSFSCGICGGPLCPNAPPRSRWSTSVDHRIPLSDIDLSSAEGRALATNPAFLVAAHTGCNSRRGAKAAAAKRRVPRIFNLAQIACRQAAGQRRSDRW